MVYTVRSLNKICSLSLSTNPLIPVINVCIHDGVTFRLSVFLSWLLVSAEDIHTAAVYATENVVFVNTTAVVCAVQNMVLGHTTVVYRTEYVAWAHRCGLRN